MSFTGNLQTVSLPDIFQLIFSTKKSGALDVSKNESKRFIYFKAGMLVYASSTDEQDLFGNILLKKGRISKEELNKVLVSQKEGKKLGALLVERKLFSREEIFECLKMQIEEIVYGLFGWKNGEFKFVEDKSPPPEAIQTELNPMNLIMEGTRRIDEWEELKKVLPTEETIVELMRDPPLKTEEIRISKNEIIVMAVVGSGRTIAEVLEDCYLDRFDTSKGLANLLNSGLISVVKQEVKEKTSDLDEQALAELLAQVYLSNLSFIFEHLRGKLGDKGDKVIYETFEQNKEYYPLLNQSFGQSGGQIDFKLFLDLYNKLPEEARLWKIVSNFNSLINDYLLAVRKNLGNKIYKRMISEIRINVQNTINRNRQLSVKYGLEEEFSRALREFEK
ncbi:MAG: DUF4388 domain-containing protein [candidate division Zixibacteria bacterium]